MQDPNPTAKPSDPARYQALADRLNLPASLSRRDALKVAVGTAIATAFPASLFAADTVREGLPYRKLGKTGEEVSSIGLGGHHLGLCSEKEAIELVRSALDRGVNFMDNCWDYHDGESERRMGKALRDGYRDKAFVMSKIDGRDRKTAMQQIDESLQRLGVDHLDLMQMHEIIRPEDPRWSFEKGGMAAMLEAKEAGKIRFLGFTGHKSPDLHVSMLEACLEHDYPLDTVQMPLNVMDAHFNSFADLVLPKLVEHGIAPIGMKSVGAGRILKSDTVTVAECHRYALNLPVSTVVVGCEKMKYLDEAIAVASAFEPMSQQQVADLLVKTREASAEGEYEGYKTSHDFDGTHKNPQWLGDVPAALA